MTIDLDGPPYGIESTGQGILDDLDAGVSYPIAPGTMYLLDGHERHKVRATTDLQMVCVFNPPCTGREVHDAEGVYPLVTEAGPEARQ